jgi:hypothetical protein
MSEIKKEERERDRRRERVHATYEKSSFSAAYVVIEKAPQMREREKRRERRKERRREKRRKRRRESTCYA